MNVVITGAGHAGVQVADTLRLRGFTGGITLVSAESGYPYQRPPLSKEAMVPGAEFDVAPLRGTSFFRDRGIDLLSGTEASRIDREMRIVHTTDGSLPYDRLVLATGARNRTVSCPGGDLPGVHGLKTRDDALALHGAVQHARHVVVVGAGFIGLEFAAAARQVGAEVTVLEFAPRVMGRAVTPVLSDWFADAHRRLGINLRLNEGIDHFEPGADGTVAGAVSTAGHRYQADVVVVGIGVQPNTQLADEAGLTVENGIVVDDRLRTSDDHVLAIGDCATFPSPWTGGQLRLESVQNATDQGRHAAGTILGDDAPYRALPWFWSIQGPYRLQMAGIAGPEDETVTLGDPTTGKFSVLSLRADRVVAVQSVNMPADHIAARKILADGGSLHRSDLENPGFDLRSAVPSPHVLATA